MKTILLSQEKVALVDDDDYPDLINHKWCAHKNSKRFYAERRANGKIIRMHRVILGVPEGLFTDHIDGNGLNNQKSNLRVVTTRENSQNRHQEKTSKFSGVWWSKIMGKWATSIKADGIRTHIGYFEDEFEAYQAYLNACKSLDNIIVFRRQTTSQYPGIYWNKNSKKWAVQICMGHRITKYLGTYSDESVAATVYMVAREVLLSDSVAKKGVKV